MSPIGHGDVFWTPAAWRSTERPGGGRAIPLRAHPRSAERPVAVLPGRGRPLPFADRGGCRAAGAGGEPRPGGSGLLRFRAAGRGRVAGTAPGGSTGAALRRRLARLVEPTGFAPRGGGAGQQDRASLGGYGSARRGAERTQQR